MISALSRGGPRAAVARPLPATNKRLLLEVGVLIAYVAAAAIVISVLPFKSAAATPGQQPVNTTTLTRPAFGSTQVVTIIVDDLPERLTFTCITQADRVASDTLVVHASDYGRLIYDLNCAWPHADDMHDT
jgi:hypothetical protein